jgi:hypothetical protein
MFLAAPEGRPSVAQGETLTLIHGKSTVVSIF